MQDKALFTSLSIAGTLPFLACALLPFFGIDSIRPFGPLDQLATSYGLAIVCFLTGIHWATHLFRHEVLRQQALPINLMVSSNLLFLVVWFAFATGNIVMSLVAQLSVLFSLLLIDWRLQKAAIISLDYFRARFFATAVAATALALIVAR